MRKKAIVCSSMSEMAHFVEETYPSTYAFALRRSGDVALAKDITQECYLKVIKRMQTQEQLISQSYLYTVVMNLHNDAYRAHQRYQETDMDYMEDPKDSPHESMMIQSRSEWIKHALLRLPMPQRDALILHYYEGMSYPQIGELLQEPSETIKSRCKLAKQKLRKLLKESELK